MAAAGAQPVCSTLPLLQPLDDSISLVGLPKAKMKKNPAVTCHRDLPPHGSHGLRLLLPVGICPPCSRLPAPPLPATPVTAETRQNLQVQPRPPPACSPAPTHDRGGGVPPPARDQTSFHCTFNICSLWECPLGSQRAKTSFLPKTPPPWPPGPGLFLHPPCLSSSHSSLSLLLPQRTCSC